ncbi:MAG TPA: helix-turn-helix domain-containing protein [Gemmatimonadaceae bacterium]
MKKSIGAQLIEGLEEAVAIERGERTGARTVRRPLTARVAEAAPAPEYGARRVAKLRARLGLSQPVFAQALNVSPETVRAWEQQKRTPDGAALRLLQVAEAHPDWILSIVRERRRGAN